MALQLTPLTEVVSETAPLAVGGASTAESVIATPLVRASTLNRVYETAALALERANIEREKINGILIRNCIAGNAAAPISLCLRIKTPAMWIPIVVFIGTAFGSFFSELLNHALNSRPFLESFGYAVIAAFAFIFGGCACWGFALLSACRWYRIGITLLVSAVMNWAALWSYSHFGGRNISRCKIWWLIMISTAIMVFFADKTQ